MKPGTFDGLTKALAARPHAARPSGGWQACWSEARWAAWPWPRSPRKRPSPVPRMTVSTFARRSSRRGLNRTQCQSDAANGTGLCYSLGPRSSGGSKSICCPSDANGQCTSYTQTSSCGSGQTCHHGTCVSTCSGTKLLNGTCAQSCSGGCSCGFCVSDLLIGSYCTTAQGSLTLCVTDLTCPKGEFCNNILGVGVCQNAVVC